MRRALFIVSMLLCISASSCTADDGIRGEELVFSKADRLYHQKDEAAPYTGTVRYYHEEYLVGVDTYLDGKKHGPSTEWRLVPRKNVGPIKRSPKRALKREAFYKNTSPDGKCTTYHRNGRIAAIRFYKNGRQDGEQKGWSATGTLTYEATYSEGHRVGEELNWTADGIPEGKNIWTNGRIVEATYYHRDGSTAKVVGFTPTGEDTTYIREWDLQGNPIVHHKEKYPDGTTRKTYSVNNKGNLVGSYREYHPNGKLRQSATYSDGHLWQWYSEFYSNGNAKVRAEYDGMGNIGRVYKEFDENGVIRLSRRYENGKLVSEEKFDKKDVESNNPLKATK